MPDLAAALPFTVQPSTILWADPAFGTPPGLEVMLCPNCGSDAPKSLVLTFDGQHRNVSLRPLNVLRCPTCACHFYDNQLPPDYTDPEMNDHGCVPFYVQQGAGVSLITRPLAQAAAPPGSSYMEVGCGYGFGLDFALNSREWKGVGIDPAPLAAVGREALNVAIELRYLRDDDEARGTIDVVMASEVIEHVPSPAAFVRTLRAMLKPGGLLMLTTPNGDDIVPASSPGVIVSLLSPTLHLVIQNTASFTALLHQAGFEHVDVQVDSHSLVAFASDSPLALEDDQARLRQSYRAHLARRAGSFDPSSDVFLGFAGRSFLESVNDGDMDAALIAWHLLLPACRARFGLDLDLMVALPAAVATCGLEEMASLVPLNLGGLLYARGIQRLNAGAARPELELQFTLAAAAANALRRALNELAMEDGQTEDIGWTASAEALLCAAAGGAANLATRLAALPPAPSGGTTRRRMVLGRAVGSLVNGGRYSLARDVVRSADLTIPVGDAPVTDAERDLIFSLSVLEVQAGPDGHPSGDPGAARRGFRQVRTATAPASDLWWAALRGEMQAIDLSPDLEDVEALADAALAVQPISEVARWAFPKLVNAGRYAAAQRLMRSDALNEPAAGEPLTDQDRDVVFCLGVLSVKTGSQATGGWDASATRARFARVRETAAAGSDLWWAAFNGELQAIDQSGGGAEAITLIEHVVKTYPTVKLGYPEMVRLVNAGQYDAAREVVRRSDLGTTGFAQPGSVLPLTEHDRDCLFCLAVLDAQIGFDGRLAGELTVARSRFARVRAATPPGSDLWWAAFRGELQAIERTGAGREAAMLVEQVVTTHPTVNFGYPEMTCLVNAGRYDAAREVVRRSKLGTTGFAQPGGVLPVTENERDCLFFLAVLDAQIGPDGRAAGQPAVGRGRFARVRAMTPPGSDLWWAALRGELQSLDLLDAQDEAAVLASEVRAANPGLVLPDDIAIRIPSLDENVRDA